MPMSNYAQPDADVFTALEDGDAVDDFTLDFQDHEVLDLIFPTSDDSYDILDPTLVDEENILDMADSSPCASQDLAITEVGTDRR
jgi:hypothetical protein